MSETDINLKTPPPSFRTPIRNLLKKSVALVFVFASSVYFNLAAAERGVLTIERPWIREAPPGVPTLAAYMKIMNNTDSSLTIIGVSSSISTRAELHEVKMDNEVMQMRKMTELIINPDENLELKPSGPHVMLVGVQQSLKNGDEVEIEFELKGHPMIKIVVPVKIDQ